MTKAGTRTGGLSEFSTPGKGDIVSLDGVEGRVLRRSLDGAAIWVVFPGQTERMFSYRGAIGKFREFPEKMSQSSLTVGRNGW